MPKHSPFAHRTNWALETNKFSKDLNQLRKDNKLLLDLTESNPTRCAFSCYEKDVILSLAEEKNFNYSPNPRGNIETRNTICKYYKEKGFDVNPQQIFLTASTSEAYSYLFRLLVDPGGKVLFPSPSYPLFSYLGDLNDININYYSLVYGEQWSVAFDSISHKIIENTKVLCLVNPNNPTGSFICRDELESINTICKLNKSALICDEVFSDYVIDNKTEHVSLVNNKEVLTFTLGGISKTLGLPQMKLSWIIVSGPKKLVESANQRLEIIADTYLSVNTPAQNALAKWFSHRPTIQNEINLRVTHNYSFLKEQLNLVKNCKLLDTKGGWYAVVKLPSTYIEEQWVLTFLNQDQVIVHPGYFFDFETEAYIILSLLPKVSTFQDGINRIVNRINELSFQKVV